MELWNATDRRSLICIESASFQFDSTGGNRSEETVAAFFVVANKVLGRCNVLRHDSGDTVFAVIGTGPPD